ncbi:hypothetical protein [Aestuariivirga sp.]|uniref:hypothetical protein n=1 Tax=Aestuariivirga sp. TaxID=2650926 RepID=UPI00391C0F00
MNESLSNALKTLCAEQRERCLYSSTTLLIWLRALRYLRIAFVVVPIVLGAIAGWDLLKGSSNYAGLTALSALLAGLVPAIYTALKLDEHLPTAARLAGEYKNLEIVFADLERAGPHKLIGDFETDYRAARERLEAANGESYTAPEWCFRRAQKKIKHGHYDFAKT